MSRLYNVGVEDVTQNNNKSFTTKPFDLDNRTLANINI